MEQPLTSEGTSMENRVTSEAPPAILLGLAEYLRLTNSRLSLEQAITLAISQWQASHSEAAHMSGGSADGRGYQWKSLFLPEGTRVRMLYGGDAYYACVSGDHLIYQGRKVTPRQFVMSISGNVRNAWRELMIRFPDQRNWRRASVCRDQQAQENAQPPLSPIASMTAAAACMAQALKTTQDLVEQAAALTTRQVERRLGPHRRDSDRLHDDCAFDS
jgi:hypothetical protein